MNLNNLYKFTVSNWLFERDVERYDMPQTFIAKLIYETENGVKIAYTHDSGGRITERWLPKGQITVSPIDDHPASQPEDLYSCLKTPGDRRKIEEAPKCEKCDYKGFFIHFHLLLKQYEQLMERE